MPAMLEHTNYTVSDPDKTAAWMTRLFGWHIRWEGPSLETGRSVHVGTDTHYLALFSFGDTVPNPADSYRHTGGLNHIAVVVDDLDAVETAVQAEGFETGKHYDYEPGRRFYFNDDDGIEYEVVQYE